MLFQQKTLTPRSVGNALIWVVQGSEENNAVEMRELENAGVDRRTAWDESLFLRAFTVHFAIVMCLRADKKREAVLNKYYRNLRSAFGDSPETWEVIQTRFRVYSEAVTTTSASGERAFSVGGAFAIFCGSSGSPLTIRVGSAIFENNYRLVSESINSINIVSE